MDSWEGHHFLKRLKVPEKEKVCNWKTLGESPLRRGNIIWTKGLVKYYATAFESTDVKPVLTITEKHVMLVTWKKFCFGNNQNISPAYTIFFDKRAYFDF